MITGLEQGDMRGQSGQQPRGGFQPQTRTAEQWTQDPFWDEDRTTLA